ncbi:MAG: aldo/keto reductase [Lactovum sp.]
MSNECRYLTLNNGKIIPQIGIGVYMIWKYEDCKRAVLEALKIGYRHIDTAQIYKNERAVGDAIRESGIPREDIFVTTKIWLSNYKENKAKIAVDKSLERMKLDYIDLILLHQPAKNSQIAWKVLEGAVENGKVHSIGLSNFNIKDCQEILDIAKIKPVVNQVECHPYMQQDELQKFLESQKIYMEVWYPLGHGDKSLLQELVFKQLAQKYKKTVPQIILSWHYQKNHILFPKSTNPIHIKENLEISDLEFTEEELQMIKALNKNKSYVEMPKWLEKISHFLSDKIPLGDKN